MESIYNIILGRKNSSGLYSASKISKVPFIGALHAIKTNTKLTQYFLTNT